MTFSTDKLLFIKMDFKDDAHMTSIKIVQFSRPPKLLSIYVQNSSIPLTFEV